ncbi:MAG: hypothetical protein R3195_18080 [Gemmatimonadota bacterium]|nr:hypothetical protein [Gemmatimonadota bacterium]
MSIWRGTPPGMLFCALGLLNATPGYASVQAGEGGGALSEERRLARRGHAGDETTYRIERENLALGDDGSVVSVVSTSGVLVRTLDAEVEPGVWTESVGWLEYRYGQSPAGVTAVPTLVEEARGVRYEVDPRADLATWLPAATRQEMTGPPAVMFTVLALDAWSWDAVLHALREVSAGVVTPGDTHSIRGWAEARDVGSAGSGSLGRYRLGAVEVSVVGLSRCQSETCLRLSFHADANEVSQQLTGMNISGREYFSGSADFSLSEGALVSGELWGPLVATFTSNGTAIPIAAVLQRVTIVRVGATRGATPGPSAR